MPRMQKLENLIIRNTLIIFVIFFVISSFFLSYLVSKKSEQQAISTLEYIRDSRYKTLNKDNLREAFDFSSLQFTSYIIDENSRLLFDIKHEVDAEISEICRQAGPEGISKSYDKRGMTKQASVKKNGKLCLVIEGNTNSSILLKQFTQNILYFFILFLTLVLSLLLLNIYRKIRRPVKTIAENSEKGLVNKWNEIQKTNTKVEEIYNLEKYSGFLIEMLKQKNNLGDSEKSLELKEFQAKYSTQKAAYDINKFKLAIDSTPNMVVIVDVHGYINYVNKALTNLTDITFSQAENKRVTDLWHKDDDLELWKGKYAEVMKIKKTVNFSSFGIKKGKLKFEADINISPIENASGNVENFLIIERDVTEERQKERIKTEFISVVSHELRTPMTVIRGYSSLLMEEKLGTLNEKQKEYLQKINSDTGRLLELANDMLDIEKFQSGKIVLKFEKQNILEITQKIKETYDEAYKNKKLNLSLENNAKNVFANVDQKYFERIISNLLSNALKYTVKGEIKIFLLNPDEEHIVLAVKDTGVGISEDALPHIFERFYQADGVMQRKQEGSGLGLSIVKTVTEAHGGMAWVESTKDVGSTFYVALPVVK